MSARKHLETALFQFTPDIVDVNYEFSAYAGETHGDALRGTQSLSIRGAIVYPQKSRESHAALTAYAATDHVRQMVRENATTSLGTAGAFNGELRGAVWIPGVDFPTLTTVLLLRQAKCISVHARKSEHTRRGWLITHFGVSTQADP